MYVPIVVKLVENYCSAIFTCLLTVCPHTCFFSFPSCLLILYSVSASYNITESMYIYHTVEQHQKIIFCVSNRTKMPWHCFRYELSSKPHKVVYRTICLVFQHFYLDFTVSKISKASLQSSCINKLRLPAIAEAPGFIPVEFQPSPIPYTPLLCTARCVSCLLLWRPCWCCMCYLTIIAIGWCSSLHLARRWCHVWISRVFVVECERKWMVGFFLCLCW